MFFYPITDPTFKKMFANGGMDSCPHLKTTRELFGKVNLKRNDININTIPPNHSMRVWKPVIDGMTPIEFPTTMNLESKLSKAHLEQYQREYCAEIGEFKRNVKGTMVNTHEPEYFQVFVDGRIRSWKFNQAKLNPIDSAKELDDLKQV